MKRLLVSLSFLFAILCTLHAAPVSLKKAQDIASDFFYRNSSYKNKGIEKIKNTDSMDLIYTPQQTTGKTRIRSIENDAEFYIFKPQYQEGFVIVAGDDQVSSIIGYSFDQSFDTEKIPEALQEYLNSYAQYIRDIRSGNIIPKTQKAEYSTKAVKPLITTQWHILEPFNYLNPSKYYPTNGIINMAQIMYYYKHPSKGTGIVSNSGQSINLNESVYDWDNMLSKYSIKSYDESTGIGIPDCSEAEAMAVAQLTRDCGFAINTIYADSLKSTSFGTNIAKALVQNFHYSPNIKTYARSNYNTESWIKMISDELAEQRPVIYIASSRPHSQSSGFICDGIDSNSLFHIIWGSTNNGYFDLNSLNSDPDNPGIIGNENNYTFSQFAILGIAPIRTDEDPGTYSKIPMLTSDLTIISQNNQRDTAEVTFSIPEICNVTGYDMAGTLGIGLYKDKKLLQIETATEIELLNLHYTSDFRLNYSLDADVEYENGNYEIVLLWKFNGETTWQLLDAGETADRIKMTLTYDKAEFSIPEETGDNSITVTSIEPATDMDIYVNDTTYFICTLKNNFNKPLKLQDLRLRFIPESQYRPGNTNIQMHPSAEITDTVLAYDRSSIKIKVKHAFKKEGTYRIMLDPYFWEGRFSTEIIQKDAPAVSVHPVPSYAVLKALNKLNLSSHIYQYQSSSIGGYIMAGNIQECGTLTGQEQVALYAKKKDATADSEFILVQNPIKWDSNGVYIDCSGQIPASDIEPGEYEVYMKYEENGVMTRLKPSSLNTGIITVKPSPTAVLYLTAPVFTENNNSIEHLDTTEVTLKLRSSLDFEGDIYVSFEDTDSHTPIDGGGYSNNIILKSGVETEIPITLFTSRQQAGRLKITYWPFPDEKFDEIIVPEEYKNSLEFTVSESKIAPVIVSSPAPTVHTSVSSVSGKPVPEGVMIRDYVGYITIPIRSNKQTYYGNIYGICESGRQQFRSENYRIAALNSEEVKDCRIYFSIPNSAPLGRYKLSHIYYEKNGQTDVWEELNMNTPFYFDVLSTEMILNGVTKTEEEDIRIIIVPEGISVQNIKTGQKLSVINATGTVIYNEKATSNNVLIPLTGSEKGIYLVKLNNRTFKVLKN